MSKTHAVEALHVQAIEKFGNGGARLIGKHQGVTYDVDVGVDFVRRLAPYVGGYYVRHKGGREEFLSANAFQRTYRPLPTKSK